MLPSDRVAFSSVVEAKNFSKPRLCSSVRRGYTARMAARSRADMACAYRVITSRSSFGTLRAGVSDGGAVETGGVEVGGAGTGAGAVVGGVVVGGAAPPDAALEVAAELLAPTPESFVTAPREPEALDEDPDESGVAELEGALGASPRTLPADGGPLDGVAASVFGPTVATGVRADVAA